jgi:hypothetical protein
VYSSVAIYQNGFVYSTTESLTPFKIDYRATRRLVWSLRHKKTTSKMRWFYVKNTYPEGDMPLAVRTV